MLVSTAFPLTNAATERDAGGLSIPLMPARLVTPLLCFSLFALALAVRLIRPSQPLLENFVDRQVHTAMMAGNLARGGSILYPEIDIGPFPAYYMLECPLYPALVATLADWLSAPVDFAGRLVSALAIALACILLFDLVRRRDGLATAILAAVAFAAMPVTIRYGRAFQPDATMLALLVAAIWWMDRWAARGQRGEEARSSELGARSSERGTEDSESGVAAPPVVRSALGAPRSELLLRSALLLASLAAAAALLLKVIAAYLLVPLAYLAWRRYGFAFLRRWELWIALGVAVLPAAAWYIHAWHVAAGSATVSTPFWQAHKWIAFDRLFAPETYRQLAYFIGLRVLTPIGLLLAAFGAIVRVPSRCALETPRSALASARSALRAPRSALFHLWLGSLALYFPILARKVDHEHYYLALAPVAAVFIARALVAITRMPLEQWCFVSGRSLAVALGIALVACNTLVCRGTFRTPSEWRHVPQAAAAAREMTPPKALVAAHSSVLFYAERRGFTFAYAPHEIAYLLGTWGVSADEPTPLELLDFYRRQGAEYFVELLGTNRERDNAAFFADVRAKYHAVLEVPGQYIVFDLESPLDSGAPVPLRSGHASQETYHANR